MTTQTTTATPDVSLPDTPFTSPDAHAGELNPAALASLASVARTDPDARLRLLVTLADAILALAEAIKKRAEITDDHMYAAGLSGEIATVLLADELVPDEPTAPEVGEIRDGWKFIGGDPSHQEAWESV